MAQFEKYSADLALALKAKTIRVQAPIMGTELVGIEVPNPNRNIVNFFNDDNSVNEKIILEPSSTNIPIGVDVHGNAVNKALEDMPHLLIAGATGQGKSVMINVCVRALSEQNTADELKFVMIDPKRVELVQFKNLPNLIPPVIYDTEKAVKALYWLIERMEDRYEMFEQSGVRDIKEYRKSVAPLFRIVVVIDEAADLILQGREKKEGSDAEKAIIRLAQKGRAAGIHLIIGTQRPSVDVISGLLKANFPTRIAFTTSSRADSQVILDQAGAEELTGKGDLLFLDPHTRGLQRLQSFLV
jgi:S-DNA-T family DNA segregation ATPase FtsK/SpoIIIE